MNDSFENLRKQMVEINLKKRKIFNNELIKAFEEVPRHQFVPKDFQNYAYYDTPLPIEENQTISQPTIVALMIQYANCSSDSKVLEIGTGSGYSTAILSKIVKEVYTVERIASLGESAKNRLESLGYKNIFFKISDGSLGWDEYSPYDSIIVTAASPVKPLKLLQQLKINGTLIIPYGNKGIQELMRFTKVSENETKEEKLDLVRFVPLIGEEGWKE